MKDEFDLRSYYCEIHLYFLVHKSKNVASKNDCEDGHNNYLGPNQPNPALLL